MSHPPPTLVVTGTADMFSADVSILERTMHHADIPLEVLKGSGMQHIYPLMPLILEGAHARDHIASWIGTAIRSHGRLP
jgi:acetyl esterase/lipase